MFHLKHFSSATCNLKCCLVRISHVKMITCGHRIGSSILPLKVLDTLFFQQWSCYVRFLNYVVNLTVPFHWTFCFFSAIAVWSLVMWFWCDFFIMSLDDFWHIVHAAFADLNCIAVENFVKLVASCHFYIWWLVYIFRKLT